MRWFFQGQTPDRVLNWFNGGAFVPKAEDPKSDFYLALPQTEDLGIKLRAGKHIEMKRRSASPVEVEIWKNGAGYMEEWRKWSFPIDLTQSSPDVSQPAGSWTEVKKHRWLRKFSVVDGQLREVDPESFPDEGCNLELAEVTVANNRWWTLCIGAFGHLDTVDGNLRLTLTHVQESPGSFELPLASSCGYPEWLAGSTP
jgi:hypothetical protein